jgi:hypothetical protein
MVDESEEDTSPPHTEMQKAAQYAIILILTFGGAVGICAIWGIVRVILRFT